jgi:hypothetical protein
VCENEEEPSVKNLQRRVDRIGKVRETRMSTKILVCWLQCSIVMMFRPLQRVLMCLGVLVVKAINPSEERRGTERRACGI